MLFRPPAQGIRHVCQAGERRGISRIFFEQAIEKDPTYAPALSGLADVADALSWYGFESPQSFVRSRQLALKAIALDDSLAEGHASLAMGLFYSDWDGAGEIGRAHV